MSKISRVHRILVGVAPLVLMAIIRSFVWYKYVIGMINWHVDWYIERIVILLLLLPVDGIISELYGFWSRERLMSFLIGFLPSTISLIVLIYLGGDGRGVFIHGGLAFGMGLMGFGGAEYKVDRKPLWLVAGFLIWLLILLTAIGTGID